MPRKTGNPSIKFPEPGIMVVQLTTKNPDLVVIKDVLDEVNYTLRKTHFGHETSLWGKEITDDE